MVRRFVSLLVPWTLTAGALLPLSFTTACGDGDESAPAAGNDAGLDAGLDAEDPGSGSDDAGTDAPPGEPNPFPLNPKAGEFASASLIEGAGDPVQVAVANDGSIFVAARQTGKVKAGDIEVPAPEGAGFVVVKLSANTKPVWVRAFDSAETVAPRAIATTPDGDVAVAGTFSGGLNLGQGAVSNAGGEDGFVVRLSGASGDTQWSAPLGSSGDDDIVAIAIDGRVGGSDAIYVYGRLAADATIGGEAVGRGACLISYDGMGARRWTKSFPNVSPSYEDGLALDPQHGPWIAGRFYGTLELAGEVLEADAEPLGVPSDVVVAGFDAAGAPRFARRIADESRASSRQLAVAPNGEIYLASDTGGGALVADDHIIWNRDATDDLFLLRLTPQASPAWSTVVAARNQNRADGLAIDASGSVYALGSCTGKVDVQPEIACDQGEGGVIVSYGPDNEYRWSTYVQPAWVESIATAPGDRLIVAGQTLSNGVDFGGIQIAGTGLFVASLVTGPAPVPAPPPATPTITSVQLAGVSDNEIRQGGSGTLVIHGSGLDRVTSARLGTIDLHVAGGMPNELRLEVAIPHGHAPGPLRLVLRNAAGVAEAAAVVQVTPVVVTPFGSATGRGTYSSPMRLCRDDWYPVLRLTDVLLLRNGIHTCNKSVVLPRGVIVRGESRTGSVVRGIGSGSSSSFRGFHSVATGLGVNVIEQLTIESADRVAIKVSSGRMVINDVDIKNVPGNGIEVSGDSKVTVNRYRYQQGSGTGLLIDGGRVAATAVEMSGEYGVFMSHGTLRLASSTVVGNRAALWAGSENSPSGARDVAVSNSTLRAKFKGVTAAIANLVIEDSTIDAVAGSQSSDGIHLSGGTLTLTGGTVRGWGGTGVDLTTPIGDISFLAPASPSSADEDVVSATIEGVTIEASIGISYGPFTPAGPGSGLSVRRSRVNGAFGAVRVWGGFDAVDLGTVAAPGENQLRTGAGYFAIVDLRQDAGQPITAHGTTVNGTTFHGDVLGPVANPGSYDVRGPNTIQFGP